MRCYLRGLTIKKPLGQTGKHGTVCSQLFWDPRGSNCRIPQVLSTLNQAPFRRAVLKIGKGSAARAWSTSSQKFGGDAIGHIDAAFGEAKSRGIDGDHTGRLERGHLAGIERPSVKAGANGKVGKVDTMR